MDETRVQLSYETAGGDPAVDDEALRSLVGELDLAVGARVLPARAVQAPDGARADAATVQAVVVSIPAVLTSVQSLVVLLQSWKRRREVAGESGHLKLDVGGDVIELDGVDAAARDRIVERWLAHATKSSG